MNSSKTLTFIKDYIKSFSPESIGNYYDSFDQQIKEHFGAELAKLREQLGESQYSFAEIVGVTPRTIQNIEAGKGKADFKYYFFLLSKYSLNFATNKSMSQDQAIEKLSIVDRHKESMKVFMKSVVDRIK